MILVAGGGAGFIPGRDGKIFNVCSGREQSVRSLLRGLLDFAETDLDVRVAIEHLCGAGQSLRWCYTFCSLSFAVPARP